jgi:BolA protein
MVRATAFEGKSRIARHRLVHSTLGPELIGRIHALALDLGV